MNMLSRPAKHEFITDWLPHIKDLALGHLAALLESHDSRLLHDDLGDSYGRGCLQVHCMMYHPKRVELEEEYPMFTETDRGYYQILAFHWMWDIVGIDPRASVLLAEWEACAHQPSWKQDIEISLLTEVWKAISERLSAKTSDHPVRKTLLAFQTNQSPKQENEPVPAVTAALTAERDTP